MMPWGHFVMAYLPYSIYTLVWRKRLPDAKHTVVLLWATQLPDLIDKPLAWTFQFLPSGRSLAHSVVFAAPYVLIVTAVAWKTDREELGALFAFGYLSHIYVDIYPTVFHPGHRLLPNLYYPLLPVQPDAQPSFVAHFARVEFTSATLLKMGLLTLALFLILRSTLKERRIRNLSKKLNPRK